MRPAALVVLVALTACQRTAPQLSVREQRHAILDGIADRCGLPRSTFKLIADDELTLKFDLNVPYERVDCGLREIKKAKLPVRMGFIGNEYNAGNAN